MARRRRSDAQDDDDDDDDDGPSFVDGDPMSSPAIDVAQSVYGVGRLGVAPRKSSSKSSSSFGHTTFFCPPSRLESDAISIYKCVDSSSIGEKKVTTSSRIALSLSLVSNSLDSRIHYICFSLLQFFTVLHIRVK